VVREIRGVHPDPLQHAVDGLFLAGQEEPPCRASHCFRVFLQAGRDVRQGVDGDGDQAHLPVEPVAQLFLEVGEDASQDGADEAARGEKRIDHHDPVADHVPREPHLPPVLVQQGTSCSRTVTDPEITSSRRAALGLRRRRDGGNRRWPPPVPARHGPCRNGGSPLPTHHRPRERPYPSLFGTSPPRRQIRKRPSFHRASRHSRPSRAGPCPDPPGRSPRPARLCAVRVVSQRGVTPVCSFQTFPTASTSFSRVTPFPDRRNPSSSRIAPV